MTEQRRQGQSYPVHSPQNRWRGLNEASRGGSLNAPDPTRSDSTTGTSPALLGAGTTTTRSWRLQASHQAGDDSPAENAPPTVGDHGLRLHGARPIRHG